MGSKSKIDDLTKAKLVYSGELALFAIAFAVLGSLFLSGVLSTSDWKKWVVLTLGSAGAIWAFVDFFWTLKSAKRRASNCLLDKILVLPSALCSLGFNVFFWIKLIPFNSTYDAFFSYFLGGMLLYFTLIYLFQAIYHWFRPLPALLETEKEKGEAEKE